jgi:hypothetical protein
VAVEAMVTASARQKIRQMLEHVAVEKKEKFSLAMLAQSSPDLPDQWSLVVSAPWMDKVGPRSAVNYLASRLKEALDKNTLSAIDRISVLSTNEPIVLRIGEILIDFLGVDVSAEPGGYHLTDAAFEGWSIPQAFVFSVGHSMTTRTGPKSLLERSIAERDFHPRK